MDHQSSIPFIAQRGANSARVVGGLSRGSTMAQHLRRLHGASPSQEETHPTLASLVADSDPLVAVEPTSDGACQFDTTAGPNNASLIAPPPAPRARPQATGTQLARALRRVPGSYQGNILASDNLSAPIPPNENCSIFVRNLPADLTHEQLFAALRGIGRIASVYINRPTNRHPTCAAKVIL
ncbi:hypothetical protein PG993_013644 [Apiospora rasikravindrae]|uniref:RRM domain-containing protein n=1 Tax=Apiospora rasikravindrae TaxID=990691 RepID=A0ABR1RQW3_9PEZI